jgi:hypothetical protein
MRIPNKPTKSAGGDPRRPHRLQRCVNQDRSRGHNYTSNLQPSMEACARIHQAQDRSWRPYVMRTPDAVVRTSPSHVYYPRQVFQRWRLQSQEGPLYQGSATQDAQSIKSFQDRPLPCPKHVGATATIFVAAQPTGTSPREDYGRLLLLPLRDLLQAGRKCQRRRGLGRSSKDLNRRSCPGPDYPARRGD